MSEQIVNALAQMKQVYLEEVGHNNLERQRLEEEVRQINEFKKPKLDRVGEEDDDIDNDGDVDSSDKYLKHRRSVVTQEVNSDLAKEILKAMKNLKKGGTPNSNESADNVERIMRSISSLKPPVKESAYYNWRDTVDESILWEIIDDTEQKQVKEKNINNYTGKNPVVTVNPEIKTESVLIDTQELNEDFIEESINIAADYLCEEGLSIEEIEDLIDELGVEEFSEWVMQLGYETLIYEETLQGELLTKELKARKKPEVSKRPGASSVVQHTPPRPKPEVPPSTKQPEGQLSLDFSKKKPSSTRGRGFTPTSTPNPRRVPTGAARKKQEKQEQRVSEFKNKLERRKDALNRNIASVQQVPKRTPITSAGRVKPQSTDDDRTGRTIRTRSSSSTSDKPAAKKGFFGAAIERDRAARQKARELINQTVQTAQKAGQAASKFGSSVREPFETKAGRNFQALLIKGLRASSRAARDTAAREVARRRVGMGEDFEFWVNELLDEGYDLSDWTWDELYEEYEVLQEKAVSEQQQKIFGLALSVKRGETPRSKVSDEVLKIVDSMSEKEIRKYAKTSHEGIPKTVDESFLVEKVINFIRENR